MSLVQLRPEAPNAGVAHPVERHLAKVEVASSSLVTRSNHLRNGFRSFYHMVPWPSGKAKVCKTFIPRFKSGRHLQMKIPNTRVFGIFNENLIGSIAQLGEHMPYKHGVTGSSPVVPTTIWPGGAVG